MGALGRTTLAECLVCARPWLPHTLYTIYSFRQALELSHYLHFAEGKVSLQGPRHDSRIVRPHTPFLLLPVPHEHTVKLSLSPTLDCVSRKQSPYLIHL